MSNDPNSKTNSTIKDIMDNQKPSGLQKISLGIQAGSDPENMNLISNPIPLEIIFGIGQEGLTPLEYALSEKSKGETARVHLSREEIPGFFEHNLPLELVNPKFPNSIDVRIRIEAISPAEAREVIQAMAALAGDCQCDCGCGGHGVSEGGGCADQSSCDGCVG